MLASKRHRRQRGVNLIEVIVALVVLGVLLALGMPAVGDWMASLRLRNAAESMRDGLERARVESLKRNSSVTFWIVADATSKAPGANCTQATNSPAWVVSVLNPAGKCDVNPSRTTDPQLVARSTARR